MNGRIAASALSVRSCVAAAVAGARLRIVEIKLRMIGSTDPHQLVHEIQVGQLKSRYGIGDGLVDTLTRHGFSTAGDLHDGAIEAEDLQQVLGIGPKRAHEIIDWSDEAWRRSQLQADERSERQKTLQSTRDDLRRRIDQRKSRSTSSDAA